MSLVSNSNHFFENIKVKITQMFNAKASFASIMGDELIYQPSSLVVNNTIHSKSLLARRNTGEYSISFMARVIRVVMYSKAYDAAP